MALGPLVPPIFEFFYRFIRFEAITIVLNRLDERTTGLEPKAQKVIFETNGVRKNFHLIAHRADCNCIFHYICNCLDNVFYCRLTHLFRIVTTILRNLFVQVNTIYEFFSLYIYKPFIMKDLELKKIRSKYNWTQKEAAERLQVTLRTVQNYEDGSRKMPESTKKLLDMILKYEIRGTTPEASRDQEPTDLAQPYKTKTTAEDIIADKVIEKLLPHFKEIENAIAEGLLSIEELKDIQAGKIKINR